MKIELGTFGNKFKGAYMIGSKPIQDWQRVMVVCFAVLLGVFIWSYFFYTSVKSEFKADFNDSSQTAPIKDKESEIKEMVDRYKSRGVLWSGQGTAITSTSTSTATSTVK